MTTRRQKERQHRKNQRERLLAIRDRKISTARFAYDCAKFYHETDNLPGVMYWEGECRLLLAQARNI